MPFLGIPRRLGETPTRPGRDEKRRPPLFDVSAKDPKDAYRPEHCPSCGIHGSGHKNVGYLCTTCTSLLDFTTRVKYKQAAHGHCTGKCGRILTTQERLAQKSLCSLCTKGSHDNVQDLAPPTIILQVQREELKKISQSFLNKLHNQDVKPCFREIQTHGRFCQVRDYAGAGRPATVDDVFTISDPPEPNRTRGGNAWETSFDEGSEGTWGFEDEFDDDGGYQEAISPPDRNYEDRYHTYDPTQFHFDGDDMMSFPTFEDDNLISFIRTVYYEEQIEGPNADQAVESYDTDGDATETIDDGYSSSQYYFRGDDMMSFPKFEGDNLISLV
ncbi:hypothetical protein EDB81DRAFT_874485 [Dactylonectria macrodidyma]|uniref:Uncharacterized protein n=1 Tax=Dactylonectria macrodidyma TaxID=307937 RepID=A0A9P9JMG4_9HYPO|nr:hypothetical protein EDB81DRAFT_874485 [Dactylonectria macrodidyma]